jgi:hypothetical protein
VKYQRTNMEERHQQGSHKLNIAQFIQIIGMVLKLTILILLGYFIIVKYMKTKDMEFIIMFLLKLQNLLEILPLIKLKLIIKFMIMVKVIRIFNKNLFLKIS